LICPTTSSEISFFATTSSLFSQEENAMDELTSKAMGVSTRVAFIGFGWFGCGGEKDKFCRNISVLLMIFQNKNRMINKIIYIVNCDYYPLSCSLKLPESA
jgi:hypothetical protein